MPQAMELEGRELVVILLQGRDSLAGLGLDDLTHVGHPPEELALGKVALMKSPLARGPWLLGSPGEELPPDRLG